MHSLRLCFGIGSSPCQFHVSFHHHFYLVVMWVFVDLQIEHILKCFLGAVIRRWTFAAIISRPLNSFYHHPLVVFSSGVRGLSALVLQYYYFLPGKRLAPYLEKSQHSILVAERLCDIFYAFLFSMVYLSGIFLFDSEVFLVILFACIFLGFMLLDLNPLLWDWVYCLIMHPLGLLDMQL